VRRRHLDGCARATLANGAASDAMAHISRAYVACLTCAAMRLALFMLRHKAMRFSAARILRRFTQRCLVAISHNALVMGPAPAFVRGTSDGERVFSTLARFCHPLHLHLPTFICFRLRRAGHHGHHRLAAPHRLRTAHLRTAALSAYRSSAAAAL